MIRSWSLDGADTSRSIGENVIMIAQNSRAKMTPITPATTYSAVVRPSGSRWIRIFMTFLLKDGPAARHSGTSLLLKLVDRCLLAGGITGNDYFLPYVNICSR